MILLSGCSWEEPPPLTATDVVQHRITGRDWLAHDLDERQAIALELPEVLVASRRKLKQEEVGFIFSEFQVTDQSLREYECVDQTQETCDHEKVALAGSLNELCKLIRWRINVDECTEASISSGIVAFVEVDFLENNDLDKCALQLETLDRAARRKRNCPVLRRAFLSCNDFKRTCDFCTECDFF